MRACVQRVCRASVTVGGELCGQIGPGLVILLGVAAGDTDADLAWLVDKVVSLRVFEDAAGKMNLAVDQVQGALLVVSQFTLLGDCRKGRRPSFDDAAPPELAEALYEKFVATAVERGLTVATGRFRQHMELLLVNDGPVTLLIDSRRAF